jgi:hypothetical protein
VRRQVIGAMPRAPRGAIHGKFTLPRQLHCMDLWGLARATEHLDYTFVGVVGELVVRLRGGGEFDYGWRVDNAVSATVGMGWHRNIDGPLPAGGETVKYWIAGEDAAEALRLLKQAAAEGRTALTRRMLGGGRRSYRPAKLGRGRR